MSLSFAPWSIAAFTDIAVDLGKQRWVDQAAVWKFTQDEVPLLEERAVVVRAEFPGLAHAL